MLNNAQPDPVVFFYTDRLAAGRPASQSERNPPLFPLLLEGRGLQKAKSTVSDRPLRVVVGHPVS